MSYILIDTMNIFFRARHVARSETIDVKIGLALHIILTSVLKTFNDHKGKHVVFCLEGRSWRKDWYAPYKKNRTALKNSLSEKEIKENEHFFIAFNEFSDFIKNHTNCTVLQNDRCEADDFIARWVQNHPDDRHVIVSTDSDFYQLLNKNVTQYNGINKQLITIDGFYDDFGKQVMDNKTKLPKQLGDPQWLLFEKCIRGDSSDNVFSAYPGARKKGTKKKLGIIDAFNDRINKGFNWNNFMLQKWNDHLGEQHVVLHDYNRNCTLIDLSLQPDDIKQCLDETISNEIKKDRVNLVGIRFLKFCGKWNLDRIGQDAARHGLYLNKKYND